MFGGLVVSVSFFNQLFAAVLPEDRADILYHKFDGGGVVIDGPSILIRKSIKDTVSISANYYVDNVSSASIDVVTTASAYIEQRVEKSMSVEYLRDKTVLSINYGMSDENDYSARTASFNFTQDFFGDLTTISAGYSQGWDVVGKRDEPEFKFDASRKQYRFGLSQILTKNSLVGISWETISDAGFLNNPYRSVRYIDPTTAVGYSFQAELYPETRTSDALSVRGMYYLPYRAAIKAEARIFSDTWGVEAKNYEIGYTHPIGEEWILDFKIRHYEQTQADFYSDLYNRIDAQNFLARDKEMSAFSDDSVGLAVSYEHELLEWEAFDKFSINLSVDYIQFDYENFRDIRENTVVGQEPFYSFDATVTRLFFSIWY
ncbi:MAG: DUF3570 domain-containing protein [Kangiellaceae bacterium]|nr:DUF3570 domain-containing protein [Kangiellaceae bacterium]